MAYNGLRGQIQFRLQDYGKDISLLGQGMLTNKLNYGIRTSLVDLVYLWYAFYHTKL